MVVKAYKASPLGRINFSMFDYSACLVREEWRVSRVCHYPTGVEPGVGGGGHPGCHGLQSGVLVGLLDRLLGRYCRGCWEGARWACWLVRRFRWVEGWHGAGFGGCACLGGCSGLGAGVLGSNRFGVGSGGAGRGCWVGDILILEDLEEEQKEEQESGEGENSASHGFGILPFSVICAGDAAVPW